MRRSPTGALLLWQHEMPPPISRVLAPEFVGTRWEERIVPAASLNYDEFDRRYVVNESLMPPMSSPVPSLRSRLRAVIPQPIRAPLGRLRHQTLFLLERLQASGRF
jgi:hypothetical protein